MAENSVMEQKKQIFKLDGRLKELFNSYCDRYRRVQEGILEGLVYLLVKKDLAGIDLDELLDEVARWKETGDDDAGSGAALSPRQGPTGPKVADALRRGAASPKRSQKGAE